MPMATNLTFSRQDGDRVLLVAHLDHQKITVFPPAALDQLVLPVLPGGEEA
jgi:hypothetical protein